MKTFSALILSIIPLFSFVTAQIISTKSSTGALSEPTVVLYEFPGPKPVSFTPNADIVGAVDLSSGTANLHVSVLISEVVPEFFTSTVIGLEDMLANSTYSSNTNDLTAIPELQNFCRKPDPIPAGKENVPCLYSHVRSSNILGKAFRPQDLDAVVSEFSKIKGNPHGLIWEVNDIYNGGRIAIGCFNNNPASC